MVDTSTDQMAPVVFTVDELIECSLPPLVHIIVVAIPSRLISSAFSPLCGTLRFAEVIRARDPDSTFRISYTAPHQQN